MCYFWTVVFAVFLYISIVNIINDVKEYKCQDTHTVFGFMNLYGAAIFSIAGFFFYITGARFYVIDILCDVGFLFHTIGFFGIYIKRRNDNHYGSTSWISNNEEDE